MKYFKIYAFLTPLYWGSNSVSAQRLLDLYFGRNNDSLANEAIKFIHGVGSNAYLYNKTAGLLQKATQAEDYAIDLRRHGHLEENSGDVDYINHYAGDLEDITSAVRKEKPNGKIIIAGHSMEGEDEIFSSATTKEAILKNSNGEFHIIDKASHNGLRHNAQSIGLMKDWFSKL